MSKLSFKNSVKFFLFLCSYMGYSFVLYFAVLFSVNNVNNQKHDFSKCNQMYIYSVIFLGFYVLEIIRHLFYIIFSVFSNETPNILISIMFIFNTLSLSYGVSLVYTTDKNCLEEYDIKNYLCVSGIGLLFFVITHIYNNYEYYWNSEQKSSVNIPLLYYNNL